MMNNARLHSELFDSLDYLVLPVKKGQSPPRRSFKPTNHLIRDFRRNIFVNSSPCTSNEFDVQTCSSLLLEENTKLIQEQCSTFNLPRYNSISDLYYPSINQQTRTFREERPTIKVTVIPKSTQQTTKVFNKRCQHSTKVQTTVSNHENSINNKPVYFLIKGNKREKVHEIKKSESANLSGREVNEKYGNILFRKISESKQIIDSLKMEKKRRKEHKNVKSKKTALIRDNCNCPKDFFSDNMHYVNDRRSRVTIVGQVGLNHEDQYILKCAATVNDKPIETTVTRDDFYDQFTNFDRRHNVYQNRYPSSKPACNLDTIGNYKQHRQQDSNVQTDSTHLNYFNADVTKSNRVTDQSTQVNLNFSNHEPRKKNQTAQCYCSRSTTATTLDTEAGDNVLKECKSPLVIISVYPRQDKDTDKDAVKIIRHTSPKRKEITNVMRSNVTQQLRETSPEKTNRCKLTKMESKLTRSRSSSPKNKHEPKKEFENRREMKGKNYNPINKGNPQQTRAPKSQAINKLRDRSACQCNNKSFGTETIDQNKMKFLPCRTNDAEQVKKALVNSFLRNVNVMDGYNRKSKLAPKDDASKVTINIEGDNERYDVFLEHTNYDAGVSIRKTAKTPHNVSSKEDTKSLEKLKMPSYDVMGKHEYSRNAKRSQLQNDVKMKPDSRLNIRDSIEISKRQGKRSNSCRKSYVRNNKNNLGESSFDTDNFAPVKHYPGDDCSVSDPHERDREIRELLGVMRHPRRQDSQNITDTFKNEGCSCRQSSKIVMGLSFDKMNKLLKHNNDRETNNKLNTGLSHLKDKRMDNYLLTQNLQSQSDSSKNLRTIEDLINTSLPSAILQTTIQDSFKREVAVKHNVDEMHKLGLLKHGNVTKEGFKVDTNTTHENDTTMSENLVLSKNIQIFLQVDQFRRKRPVLLTQKQYEKVKKIVDRKISRKFSIEKRKRSNIKYYNVVSVGEIKVKPKLQMPLAIDRSIQTFESDIKKQDNCLSNKNKTKNEKPMNDKVHQEMDKIAVDAAIFKDRPYKERKNLRQAVSSVEIRYAQVKYEKCIAISTSSTRFNKEVIQSLQPKNIKRHSNSILTIFKGHKKSVTPNLGTSAFSLYSDETNYSHKTNKPQCDGDFKSKKPFLQRLISCIIMRSNETSNVKNITRKETMPTFNTSDSYHLSTSLALLDMNSSLYDTSASFYSNHTILPVNKMKKGFFSSVREFLRRS